MHVAHIVSLLAVFAAATTAAPSPKRAHIARTTGEIHARAPFNPYHAAHRFAATADMKKRASNHGRDMAGASKEKRRTRKEKSKARKRGTECAVRTSSSVDALVASSTASATEYYVPSSASASASASATATGPYVQNAAVNNSDLWWSSPSSSNGDHRHSSSASSSTDGHAVPSSSSSSTSTTTPAPAWTSTSTSSTAPATTSASSGTDWKTGGHATYYYQNGNAGACGDYHADSDPIIAINGAGYWSDYGVKSPYCGKWVTIKNPANGKQVQAKVADVCPTCTGSTNSIDLSVGAFEAIATLDQGQVDIEWAFNN